ALIKSIARGRAWLDEIVSGTASIEAIAARQKCSVRYVNMTISMAFIAPALVKAAVEGRLPRGIGIATLRDAPAEWSLQFDWLGLANPCFPFFTFKDYRRSALPAATAHRRNLSAPPLFGRQEGVFLPKRLRSEIGRLRLPENERLEGRIEKARR